MNELVLKTHDFELAKKGLKEFSQKMAEELELDTVRTDGGFLGLGDHKVTGYELNNRLSTIQQHLIDLNNTNNRTIEEFGQVYFALEALDKDYIQAILISIKATEKTSERIQATQVQIRKIVDDQKKTLEILKKFKQKLDGYAHLGDIDKMWNDYQEWNQVVTTFSNSVSIANAISKENALKIDGLQTTLKVTDKKWNELSKQLNQHIVKLEDLITFTSEMENIVHLQDIDEMWDSLLDAHNKIKIIESEISSFKSTTSKHQSDIETLLSFIGDLSSYEHLNDIDDIWNSNKVHSSKLSELENQSKETKNIIQTNKDLADAAITSAIEMNYTAVQLLTKKIKYAYLLAGGSLGLALIELIVILLKVV
ncbi:MAG: hypothetical protein WBI07_07270 [Mobilitalea sp.]